MRGFKGSIVVILAILFLAPAVRAQDGPEVVVEMIYAAYQDGRLGTAPTDPGMREVFSTRLAALLVEEDRRVTSEGIGRLDFDVFVDGQDFDITDLNIGEPTFANNRATVEVALTNMGLPCQFRYSMVQEAGGWKIDELEAIGSDAPWRLTQLLSDE